MPRMIPESAGDSPVWIDLDAPDPGEVRRIEERYGISVPGLDALREIESTSRLRAEGTVLYMTAPMISRSGEDVWTTAPTGFILTPDVLVTVRYAELQSFAAAAADLGDAGDLTPAAVLARLLEEAVDRAADQLEHASDVVASVSRTIFFDEMGDRGLSKETRILRDTIRTIGRASDRASRVRYMFLSVGRMVTFVADRCTPKLSQQIVDRLAAIGHDITSLDEFENSLTARIQLLQDAATSLISIEQNEVVKVLTVASVVGVPPVLVVGVYGMNFRNMPELGWHWGYPFALLLCVVSALVPYAWFKWRGWI